jgi:glucans biosynthesis protein C
VGADVTVTNAGGAVPVRTPAPRLAWIDNVRTTVIFLVVHMHACVTYSHVGGWYVNEGDDPPILAKVPFIVWQGHLQAFFMGLLFFLSGVFAQRSLAKRGPVPFTRERLVRLGLPAALFMTVIHPFTVAVLIIGAGDHAWASIPEYLARYYTSTRVLSGNGPLWFALALLFFCLVFAALPRRACKEQKPPPGARALLGFGLALAVSSFFVRIVQPIGTNVLNMQLCFFPQYIAAFIAGVAAARSGWLDALVTSRRARVAGWMALIVGPLVQLTVMILGGEIHKEGEIAYPYAGGFHWQAAAIAAWEQFSGLGLALGLMAWFRAKGNDASPLARWLSDRSFGVYVLHTPVLVAITPLLRPLHADIYDSALILTAVGLALSYLAADLAKRTPGLRAIL